MSLVTGHTSLLFVYGTLRRGFSRHKFLEAAGTVFVSRGTTRARLFDLGEFPGAIPSTRDSDLLTGEVYRLANPVRALKLLDQVEAFGPVSPSTSLFRRALVEVTLENGSTVRAWVYWLNRWHGPRRRIASGNYAGRVGSDSRIGNYD
jgi:pyruvate carboxylase